VYLDPLFPSSARIFPIYLRSNTPSLNTNPLNRHGRNRRNQRCRFLYPLERSRASQCVYPALLPHTLTYRLTLTHLIARLHSAQTVATTEGRRTILSTGSISLLDASERACLHLTLDHQFDPVDRDAIEPPAVTTNKDGVYQCKKHGSAGEGLYRPAAAVPC
jgi:hypothetical protein